MRGVHEKDRPLFTPFPAIATPDEGRDDDAIRAVARNCGLLAVGCSDAAGYVAGVSTGITAQLTALRDLEGVTSALVGDQQTVARSTSEARRLSEQARATLTRESAQIAASIGDFAALTDLITRLGTRMTDFAAAMEQVQRVSSAIDDIARKTNLLALNATIEAQRAGDAGRTFAVVAAEVKKLALETRQATDEITRTMESFTHEAVTVIREIDDGVGKSVSAQRGVEQISHTVGEVAGIVARVDAITDDIQRSTEVTSGSVARVRDTLTQFGTQARDGGARLDDAQERMHRLELQSNEMLNQLAHSGTRLDDSRFVELAMSGMQETRAIIEGALHCGKLTRDDVFDTTYVPIPGTDPVQYDNRLCAFADSQIRPLLDRIASEDVRRIVVVTPTDVNGYLPTHLSSRSLPQRPGERDWNAENCRNRRNFMDEVTARAVAFEGDFMLAAYRQNLSEGRYRAIKNVFVPLWVDGRRWGNFELAFVD